MAKDPDFDPVCPLNGNLYGHPIAGLLWDKFSQEKILAAGFEKVRGWESLYVHKKWQIFLGVYVKKSNAIGKLHGGCSRPGKGGDTQH